MEQLFSPVKKVKIFQDVIDQIQDAIFKGHLKVGQRLPAEEKLEILFQASRPTIREAIKVMEYQGLIQRKPGPNGGLFVKSRQSHALSDTFNLLMRSRNYSLDDLAEFREKIEGDAVEIAASNFTDQDLFQLEKLIQEAETYSQKGKKSVRKFINADIKFHLRLCMIAGNPLFNETLKAIYSMNAYYKRFFDLENKMMKENLQDLKDIFSAFSSHRSEEAKTISRYHISKFNAHY